MRKSLWLIVAIAGLVLVLAIDSPATNCSFVFDDWPVIQNNPALHSPSLGEAMSFNPFRSAPYFSYWLQIRAQAPAAQAGLITLDAAPFRAVNVTLHWLAGLIVMYLTFVLSSGKKAPALLAGFLFWLDPVFLEAVNFILGRTELMLAIFYLAAVCFYLDRRRPLVSLTGFFACLLLALFTKEIAVTLPSVVLLLSFFRAENWKRPELIGGAVLVVIFIALRLNWTIELAKTPEQAPSWPGYFLDQNWIFWLAAFKTLIPFHLNFDYQLGHHAAASVMFLIFNFILLTFLLFSSLRGARSGWLALIYVLIYLPLAVIPLADPLRESRLYLPGIWLVIIFSLAFFPLLENKNRLASAFFIIILICMSLLTMKRARVWHSEAELWRDALAKSPEKFRPAYNYGTALRKKLELDRAKKAYLWAKKIAPENSKLDWALSLIEEAEKHPGKIKELKDSLESNSGKPPND